jgi:hypothetical protein
MFTLPTSWRVAMGGIARQKDPSLIGELLCPPLIYPIIRDPVITKDLHLESAQGILEEPFKVFLVDSLGVSGVELVLG